MRIVIVLVLIAFALSGCAATDPPRLPTAAPSPTSKRLRPTPASPTATATTLPDNPDLVILDVAFVDAQRGWLLAEPIAGYPMVLRVTTDGGHTWSPAPLVLIPDGSGAMHSSLANRMRFSDALNGWLYSPGLFSTHDGGKTWTDERRMIVALEPRGQSVWAIEQRGQTRILIISNDAGRTWNNTPTQPPDMRDAQLARADDRNAYLLLTSPTQVGNITIFRTGDAGATWERIADPTGGNCSEANRIATAPDTSLVWLFCGSQPATIMQGKTLYASSDYGAHWTIVAENDLLPGHASIGQISVGGYLVGTGRDVGDLVIVSSTTGFITPSRSTLSRTQDGGKTWQESIPYARANGGGDPRVGPIRWIDAQHLWVPGHWNHLFITANGGNTWDEVTVM